MWGASYTAPLTDAGILIFSTADAFTAFFGFGAAVCFLIKLGFWYDATRHIEAVGKLAFNFSS
jgi:hypothetical protein